MHMLVSAGEDLEAEAVSSSPNWTPIDEALRKQMRHKRIATAMQYYVHIKEDDLMKAMYK